MTPQGPVDVVEVVYQQVAVPGATPAAASMRNLWMRRGTSDTQLFGVVYHAFIPRFCWTTLEPDRDPMDGIPVRHSTHRRVGWAIQAPRIHILAINNVFGTTFDCMRCFLEIHAKILNNRQL